MTSHEKEFSVFFHFTLGNGNSDSMILSTIPRSQKLTGTTSRFPWVMYSWTVRAWGKGLEWEWSGKRSGKSKSGKVGEWGKRSGKTSGNETRTLNGLESRGIRRELRGNHLLHREKDSLEMSKS